MTLVDANVLIYAVNRSSPQHAVAKAWLDDSLSGDRPIGLPWLCLLAFLRIATHPSVFSRPLTMAEALSVVAVWCEAPHVVHPEPGRAFAARLTQTMAQGLAAGKLVNDGYLATLALEHGAVVATFDRDFARFHEVATLVPSLPTDDPR